MSLNKPIYKLRDWDDIDKTDYSNILLYSKGIKILFESHDKIKWIKLTSNSNIKTFELLELNDNNLDFIYSNPHIFSYDYQQMKINNQLMEEELLKEILKPSRFLKNVEIYGDKYYNLFE